MPAEVYTDQATTTVASGGTTAPAGGTQETWTVASSSSFPAASSTATPPTQFHVADTADGKTGEIIAVTNVSGTTWTVTRGAESTTPVAHSAGFTIVNLITSGGLNGMLQAANNLSDVASAPAALNALGGAAVAGDIGGTSASPQVTGTHLASALPLNQGGTGSASRNFGGLLTPTAVKTTTYTAAAGDFVPCDTTSGSFTVTLPNAPADLTVVGVKQVIQGGSNTVTVACAGSDVFNKTSGAVTATLTLLAQGLLLQYKASGGIWYVTADDLPLPQLDLRYLALAGGTMTGSMGVPLETVTTTNTTGLSDWITLCNAAGGGFTNTLPDATAVRSGASYVFKKADATANEVKLNPVSAQTVDGASYYVLAAANATVTLVSDGSNWWVL